MQLASRTRNEPSTGMLLLSFPHNTAAFSHPRPCSNHACVHEDDIIYDAPAGSTKQPNMYVNPKGDIVLGCRHQPAARTACIAKP
eukprot:316649-Chlamydomonas_euryale.AAC.4